MADSKKRVAGTQLTRDNPDPDENEPEPEMGSFRKASEEVMAKRRIVKVKRAQQQTAPSTNPFAAIRLAPPSSENVEKETEKIEKPVENQNGENEEIKNENGNGSGSGSGSGSDSVFEIGEKSEKIEAEEVKGSEGSENLENVENKTEAKNENETLNENEAEQEKPPVQTAPLSSFGQLSSSQNAFSGLASIGTGTGFSARSFSFDSSTTTNGSGSASLFGSKPDTTLKEVPVETGEENESAVFTADAVLFEYLEGGWKERGKGEVKLNVPIKNEGNNNNKARLVMRTKGNYRLVLNASLYADMSLKDMDKRGVTFACLNSAGEGGEKLGLGLSTFALKFRDGGVRDEFREIVSAHKGDNKEKENKKEAAVLNNTPDNSPKES